MKIFIATPFENRTDSEIIDDIDSAEKWIMDRFENAIIRHHWHEAYSSRIKLDKLANDIKTLGQCDACFFGYGWERYPECQVEHAVCEQYGIEIIEEEAECYLTAEEFALKHKCGYKNNRQDQIKGIAPSQLRNPNREEFRLASGRISLINLPIQPAHRYTIGATYDDLAFSGDNFGCIIIDGEPFYRQEVRHTNVGVSTYAAYQGKLGVIALTCAVPFTKEDLAKSDTHFIVWAKEGMFRHGTRPNGDMVIDVELAKQKDHHPSVLIECMEYKPW